MSSHADTILRWEDSGGATVVHASDYDALLAENADAKHGQELALLDADNERRIACEARAEKQRLRDALLKARIALLPYHPRLAEELKVLAGDGE